MKKRIVSLLLLAAMLITAIPVMTAAVAAEENQVQQETYVDLHTLYVQDGLQNLFTTFGDKTGLDLTAGTWTARAGKGVATIGNKDQWSLNDDGSFGYNMYYGTYIDGTYTASTSSATLGSNYWTYGTRLELGIDLLPADDFTLEYLVEHKPYYVTDGNGKLVLDENEKPIETYVASNGVMPQSDPGNRIDNAVMRIGYLQAFTYNFDGCWNNTASNKRGSGTQWKISGTWHWARANSMGMNYSVGSEFFLMNEGMRTYAITRDETSSTTATYVMYKDGATFTTSNFDVAKVTANVNGYAAPDFSIAEKDAPSVQSILKDGTPVMNKDGVTPTLYPAANKFWLAERHGTDFYAIRIYDRVLNEDERIRNRAVDVMLTYGVELKPEYAANLPAMQTVYEKLSTWETTSDPAERLAGKTAIEALIKDSVDYLDALDMSDTLYVTDGLTSLFTAFENDARLLVEADGSNHIWHNRVDGQANATFKGAIWDYGETGGFGKYYIYGTYTDGTFSTTNASNTSVTNDYSLYFGNALLPKDDFTVEYLAFFPQIYAEVVVDGEKTSEFYGHYTGIYTESGHTVDQIGWLEFNTVYPGGRFDSMDNYLRSRIAESSCTGWGGTSGTNYGFGTSSFRIDKRNTLKVDTYTLLRDETTVTTDDVVTEQKATYSFRHNAVAQANGSRTYTTKNGFIAEGGTSKDAQYFFGEDDGDFWLSKSAGATFYAVRIYDRVLSEAEQKQNRLADILYYYDVALTAAQTADTKLLDAIYENFNLMSEDALEKAAEKLALEAFITEYETAKAADNAIINSYAAPEHLTALFSVYADNSVDLTNGTWRNLMGGVNATFGTNWVERDNGAFGFDMWAGFMTTTDGVATYTAGKTGVAFPTGAYISNNHPTSSGYALNLGLSNLSTEDFTVEYQALYRPVLVADASKSTADTLVYYEQDGAPLAAYDIDGNNSIPDVVSWACDVFGWFSTRTMNTDGGSGWSSSKRGTVHWMVGHPCWGSGANYKFVGGGWATGIYNNGGEALHKAGVNSFFTYTVSVDETVTDTGDTEALLAIYRDAELFGSNAANVNSTANEVITSDKGTAYYDYGKGYPTQTDFSGKYGDSGYGTYFYLSAGTPTDFLTVRVYDKVLTEAEQKFNRVVDVMYYYDLTIDDTLWADEAFVEALTTLLLKQDLVADAAEKEATATDLQAKINILMESDAASKANDYTSLYVTDGLVGLFFADNSIDIVSGTWENKAPNGNYAAATLKGAWQRYEKGVGYRIVPTETSTTANLVNMHGGGVLLDTNFEDLENFTVETFAKAYGATDAEGNRINNGAHYTGINNFRFGLLTSLGWMSLHTNLNNRWAVTNIAYTGGSWTATQGFSKTEGATYADNYNDTNWYTVGKDVPTAALMTVTKATDEDSVLYSIFYNNATPSSSAQFDVPTAEYERLAEYTTGSVEAARRFSLFNVVAADIYSVRVYNKVLTADEKAQNRLADLLYYHDVDIPENFAQDKDTLLAVANNASVKSISISEDAAAKAANKAALETAIAEVSKKVTVTVGGGETLKTDIILSGGSYELPEEIGEKKVIAWKINGNDAVLPGTSVSVDGDMNADAVVVDSPKTSTSVSVKTSAVADDLAMRFTASISRSDFEAIAEAYGREKLTVGILITPAKYVEMAGGVFTREALRAMVDYESDVEGAPAFVNIPSPNGFYSTDATTMTIAGSLYRFSEATRNNNPAFAAIGYVDIDVDGDLTTDFTLYGEYNPAANHTVKETFTKARPFMTNTQKTWIDALINSFVS